MTERLVSSDIVPRKEASDPPEVDSAQLIAALHELIDALDSRVPHVERAGEAQIALDAAKLRQEAVNRIQELTHAAASRSPDV